MPNNDTSNDAARLGILERTLKIAKALTPPDRDWLIALARKGLELHDAGIYLDSEIRQMHSRARFHEREMRKAMALLNQILTARRVISVPAEIGIAEKAFDVLNAALGV